MSLLVAGTVAIDDVKTPQAEEKQLLGGSAAYAAIAASFFHKPVELVGVIGNDFPEAHTSLLESKGINLDGLEQVEDESFHWSGEYFENMNRRETLSVSLNVLENWQPKVHETGREAEMIVLANMSPENQLTTLDQCDSPHFVIADTMDLWIDIAQDKLHEVMQRIDLLVLNDGEAMQFTGTNNLIEAGEILQKKGPGHVIIKLGEHGSFLFGDDHREFFRCAAYPLKEVFDPTGAGDSFLGAMAGYLVHHGATKPNYEDMRQAVVRGSIMASFTCEAFSTKRLAEVTPDEFEDRLAELRELIRF